MSTKIALFAFFCVVVVKVRDYIIENMDRQGPSDWELFIRNCKRIKETIKKRKEKR